MHRAILDSAKRLCFTVPPMPDSRREPHMYVPFLVKVLGFSLVLMQSFSTEKPLISLQLDVFTSTVNYPFTHMLASNLPDFSSFCNKNGFIIHSRHKCMHVYVLC